ncbi:MAG: low-specificity L-threonine aldolase [Gemmataceae bacterium]|nr:low-specificity L-threonine aldolase [Gemmataceae bacterium]
MPPIIDLRSDTVTRPSPGMREAMSRAEVGDDVFGDDPTVRKLEERVAALLGKEAAIFVPSGTMSNQIGIRLHARGGDELLCDLNCHIFQYEGGSPAALSGITCRTFDGRNGILELEQLEGQIHPDDPHATDTKLVCLENTHNRGGGVVYPIEKIAAISRWARSHGLAMHLDGARLWNAAVATGIPLAEWGRHFDTVSVCFSKGLGAPIGSALCLPKSHMRNATRIRKLFGGGMRQVGILAAAALYALDRNVERLTDDHRNARILAEAIRNTPGLRTVPEQIETNLVWFRIDPSVGTAKGLADALAENGVLVHSSGPSTLRACTHLDVTRDQVQHAADLIHRLAGQLHRG